MKSLSVVNIEKASGKLFPIVKKTPLQKNYRLSEKFKAKIFFKREDVQRVRSYKIRGALNKILLLSNAERKKGVVCASAGNHAQGVALSCALQKIKGVVFMPLNTPAQKIERVKYFGNGYIEIRMAGDNFDESKKAALDFAKKTKRIFIHPFEDAKVIEGQGTIGVELLEQIKEKCNGKIDYVMVPVGGGGLIGGLGFYLKNKDKKIKVIGVEATGSACMNCAVKKGKPTELDSLDTFVDGTAVKKAGKLNYDLVKKYVDKILVVPEGKVCTEMIDLYQNEGVVAEPAGALSVAALDCLKSELKGKNVICIISGGNNDITRYPEIQERSLIYKGLKHYFLIQFSQRPGSLRLWLEKALGEGDDITLFEYIKKNNKEYGPALVGIELAKKEDYKRLLKRMDKIKMKYEIIERDSALFQFMI